MTTIDQPIVRVTIGQPGLPGLTWSDLYCEFEVEKTSTSAPNKVKCSLYNLAETSLKAIEQPGNVIQILAGKGGMPSSLCYADIPRRGVKTEMKGVDQVTEITAAEGQRIFREATITAAYPGGTTRSTIMLDVIAAARCKRGYIDPLIPERVFPSLTVFDGLVRDVLVWLWSPDGAIAFFEGETLHVLGPGRGMPAGNAPLISEATGMIGSPTRTDKGGVEVSCELLPSIRPGQPFALKSRFTTGNFRAAKVSHKGNTWATTWETKIHGVAW